jgi:ankyrin repeat protein
MAKKILRETSHTNQMKFQLRNSEEIGLFSSRTTQIGLWSMSTGVLRRAAYVGDVSFFTPFLLANKSELNGVDEYDGTILMYATLEGHTQLVKVLLMNNVKVNLKTKGGHTALMLAVQNNRFGTVQVLMQHKALLYSVDAELASYCTIFRNRKHHHRILDLVEREQRWRRRGPFMMFWSALNKSMTTAGTLTLHEEVLRFDYVGRKVASWL